MCLSTSRWIPTSVLIPKSIISLYLQVRIFDIQLHSDIRSDVRLDIHSDTRAYPPLSNHLLSPILPTPLTATSLGPHPSDSTSDICHMSVLRVPRGSELLVTPTPSLVTEHFLHCATHTIWPKDHHSKSYLSHPIFHFRLHHHSTSHLYSTLSAFAEGFPHSTTPSISPKECHSYLSPPIFHFRLHHHSISCLYSALSSFTDTFLHSTTDSKSPKDCHS